MPACDSLRDLLLENYCCLRYAARKAGQTGKAKQAAQDCTRLLASQFDGKKISCDLMVCVDKLLPVAQLLREASQHAAAVVGGAGRRPLFANGCRPRARPGFHLPRHRYVDVMFRARQSTRRTNVGVGASGTGPNKPSKPGSALRPTIRDGTRDSVRRGSGLARRVGAWATANRRWPHFANRQRPKSGSSRENRPTTQAECSSASVTIACFFIAHRQTTYAGRPTPFDSGSHFGPLARSNWSRPPTISPHWPSE